MYKKIGLSIAYFLPAVAFATGPSNLKDVICLINQYLGYIIPLLFSIALVFFIIGIVKFFVGGVEKLAEAKQMALWGIIGLFVMFSVWGLVNILINTFSFDNKIPGLSGPGSFTTRSACDGASSGANANAGNGFQAVGNPAQGVGNPTQQYGNQVQGVGNSVQQRANPGI